MLTNEKEEKICKKYSARDENGRVNCRECPLIKGNPNRYDFRCKANSHFDRHKGDWIYDDWDEPFNKIVINTANK